MAAKSGRYQKAKAGAKKAYHHAKSGMARVKPVAIATGVGAAAGFATGMLDANVGYAAQNWWVDPALLVVTGVALAKKNQSVACGLGGAAGMLGYIKYSLAHPATVKGYPDTGAPQQMTDGGVTLGNDGMGSEAFETVNVD